jgi:molybdopterin-guanine dinucleotide biosynthesis protein MobB
MVSFVAPSGTGKTTLLEGVVAELHRRGYRVGAVKHDAHRIELDTEGKDSWRLRQAGSASTLLMGRNQLAWFGEDDSGPNLREVAPLFFADVDVILVEGFRSADLPAVLVTRPGHGDGRWEMPDRDRIIATVGPDDVDEVADLLVERFLTQG